jgi:MraZ protein
VTDTEGFWGSHRHKVDGKGRVSIPSDFRAVLEAEDPKWTKGEPARVLIHFGRAGRQRHLRCFTMRVKQEVLAGIDALPRGSPRRRKLERDFTARSVMSKVDETGRLVLSQALRDQIEVSDTALFVAMGDSFEIWNPDIYDEEDAKYDEVDERLPDDFDLLELLPRGETAEADEDPLDAMLRGG